MTITDASEDDSATYTCEATKDGVTASDDFEVDVHVPAECQHEDGTTWREGTIYNPRDIEACTCDAQGQHECECIDNGQEVVCNTGTKWLDKETCETRCIPGRF